MASLQQLKKRISATVNIEKMCNAMELVATTKMRRAQETALSSRPYAYTALEILGNVIQFARQNDLGELTHPLLTRRDIKKALVVLTASDKGLAGSFNSATCRALEKYCSLRSESFAYMAIGKKAADYLNRTGRAAIATYTRLGDVMTLEETQPITDFIIDGYVHEEFDEVVFISTNFVSALKQEVVVQHFLPLDFIKLRETVENIIPLTGKYSELRDSILASRTKLPTDYLIEPSAAQVFGGILPFLVSLQVYDIILEANASEHSARRVAMKSATDNAGELIGSLQRSYNRSRQAAITKEITEITGTTAALSV